MLLPGGYALDLKFGVQINILDPTKQRKVIKLGKNNKRQRPGDNGNARWADSKVVAFKNDLKFSKDSQYWL